MRLPRCYIIEISFEGFKYAKVWLNIYVDTPSVDEILKFNKKFIEFAKKESNLPLIRKYLHSLVSDITVNDNEIKVVFSL